MVLSHELPLKAIKYTLSCRYTATNAVVVAERLETDVTSIPVCSV